jgi:branched-chain amino acid:cation transporter, LIVCS family
MQSRLNLTITSGFAMFAMFFGSGNLVFPLAIGTETTGQAIYSIIGLIITGVFVPFFGLLAMILFKGNREAAFSYIGKWPAFFLSFAMLSLMGPFGVAARCIIVAYGGIAQLMPISLEVFGLVWSIITGLIIISHSGWINVIGRYLTPILLLSIALIITAGLWYAPSLQVSSLSSTQSFEIGLEQGYQTMDLLAAFFFSVTVVSYLQQSLDGQPMAKILKLSLRASIVGATLLAAVYVGFVLLGALYCDILIGVAPEQRLAVIAYHTLGGTAQGIIATSIALACLTTFIVLIVLFSQFLSKEISQNRIPYTWSIWITLGISYGISLLGFHTLATWIAYALEIAYPALIAFSIALITYKLFRFNLITLAFWGTLSVTIILQLVK